MTLREIELKNWLNRAFYADKKVKALKLQLKQCEEDATDISAKYNHNDAGKSDGSVNVTEGLYIRIHAKEEEIKNEIKKRMDIVDEIEEVISRLQDDDLEAVLRCIYVSFCTIEKAAETLHYHPNNIKNKKT